MLIHLRKTCSPGHCCQYHTCCEFPVILGSDYLATVMSKCHIQGFRVKRTGVCRRHRDYAQVPNVAKSSVQIVYSRTKWVKVSDLKTRMQ